jgi:hypothetical protein
MGPRSQIGFHAAYNGDTREITSTGNALVGAYLNKIGLPYSAVVYITAAAPDAVTWLNAIDAMKLGIEVSFFKPSHNWSTPAKSPNTSAGSPPDRTHGGYLVLVASQQSEADARTSYQLLQAKYPSLLGSRLPVIHRADLGDRGILYRATVGPFASPDEAAQFCRSLKAAGAQCVILRN